MEAAAPQRSFKGCALPLLAQVLLFIKVSGVKAFPSYQKGTGKVYLFHPTINVGVRETDFGEIGC